MKTYFEDQKLIRKAPNIFEYRNYRNYLREFSEFKISTSKAFSFRQFHLKAGVNSPNYLQKVIKKEKNLGLETTEKFISALDISGKKAEYFRLLVQYDQTELSENKTFLLRKIMKLGQGSADPNWFVETKLRDEWYHLVIWELASCKDMQLTPENIVRALNKEITPTKAQKSVELLVEHGYLLPLGNSFYKQKNVSLTSSDDVASDLLKKSHRLYLRKAIERLEEPVEDREFQGLTVAISEEKWPELKEKIKEFMKDLAVDFSDDSKAKKVYRVNCQSFALTKEINEEGSK